MKINEQSLVRGHNIEQARQTIKYREKFAEKIKNEKIQNDKTLKNGKSIC